MYADVKDNYFARSQPCSGEGGIHVVGGVLHSRTDLITENLQKFLLISIVLPPFQPGVKDEI